jgi:uncharacterized membrane protein YphA (DoxX/SURF4 family)
LSNSSRKKYFRKNEEQSADGDHRRGPTRPSYQKIKRKQRMYRSSGLVLFRIFTSGPFISHRRHKVRLYDVSLDAAEASMQSDPGGTAITMSGRSVLACTSSTDRITVVSLSWAESAAGYTAEAA